jgi:hypothetical protein
MCRPIFNSRHTAIQLFGGGALFVYHGKGEESEIRKVGADSLKI